MDSITVKQLKAELGKRNLSTTGNKRELYQRLLEVLSEKHEDISDVIMGLGKEGEEEGAVADVPGKGTDDDVPGDGLDEVSANDSVSQVGDNGKSIVSRRSCAGSVARRMAMAAAKKEALKVKLSRKIELDRIEQKEMDLKQKKERLLLEMGIAEAEAEEHAFFQFDQGRQEIVENESESGSTNLDIRKVEENVSSPVVGTVKRVKSTLQTENLTKEIAQQQSLHSGDGDQELIKMLVSCNLKGLMPAQEVRKFDGDEAQYSIFISTFDSVIASKLTGDRDRLQYLNQYTVGRPNDIVSACLHLEPSVGYHRAREMLQKRYGDPERIATAYVDKVLAWHVINRDDVEALDEFSIALDNCRNAVACVPFGVAELNNPKTMRKILEKLPFHLQEKWRHKADDLMVGEGKQIHFDDLADFVGKEARVMRNPVFGRHLFQSKEKPRGKIVTQNSTTGARFKVNFNSTTSKFECWYCKGSHILDECERIKALDHKEKLKILQDLNLCFGCLRSGHRAKTCRKRKACCICKSNDHPSLLHRQNDSYDTTCSAGSYGDSGAGSVRVIDNTLVNGENDENLNANQARETIVNHTMGTGEDSDIRIFTSIQNEFGSGMSVVPVRVQSDQGEETRTYAFLDNGSSVTFCDRALADRLKLKNIPNMKLSISTIQGKKDMDCAVVSGLKVFDYDKSESILLPPVYVINKIPIEEGDYMKQSDLKRWPHLRDVTIPECTAKVELMIGTNVPQALEPLAVVRATREFEPFAVRTKLGWMVCGAGGSRGVANVNKLSVAKGIELDQALIKEYNKDFQDLASVEQEMSNEDKLWLKFVEKNCKLVRGKYQIPIPLKSKVGLVPDSREAALKRLKSLRRKLIRNKLYFEKYAAFISDMFDKGYAEPVPNKAPESDQVWYIPHFGVTHADKPDKVRIVFDCAARVDGVALNDLIMQGPDLLSSLLGVLLRFRVGLYAYTADIETMFYQIRVPEEDRDWLRFFWWEGGDISKNPSEYRMAVHLFGSCSSPSIANFALKQTALQFSDEFCQDVCDTVKNNFYVDDCLRSEDSVVGLVRNAEAVRGLCKRGGFNLVKFTCPDRYFLEQIPEHLLGKCMGEILQGRTPKGNRALGISWDMTSDSLGISFKDILSYPSSKRELLSFIASIYDPLGVAAPAIIRGRLIMQDLCRLKYKWDDKFDDRIKLKVNKWIDELNVINAVYVARCIKPVLWDCVRTAQLHIFSDASQDAYGVVVYSRFEDKQGQVYCNFVLGKARVAPLKAVSIPRLELSAAVLAVRLKLILLKHLDYNWSVYFWTDSTTVLHYIRNDTLRYQTFVANRVAVICDGSEKQQWRYVNTEENAADDATRGKQSSRWSSGPEFLLREEQTWPKEPEQSDGMLDLEIKRDVNKTVIVNSPVDRIVSYYSEWYRLCKAISWFLLFIDYLRLGVGGKNNLIGGLNVGVMKRAELAIVRYVQMTCFSDEVNSLKNGKSVIRSSTIVKLNPMLCDGLLRVGGRLGASDLAFEEKHPLILPYKGHVTDLIVRDYHAKSGHMGRMYVLSELRKVYWIIKGNSAVRGIIKDCIICKRLRRQGMQQQMAQLPETRLEYSKPPFYVTGVDYFGPFFVKQGRSQVKRYGVIYTCLTMRAVHLEVAVDLSASAFINTLRRFLARRGNVRTIKCDRGTNFVGAKSEIDCDIGQYNTEVKSELLKRGIDWEFNPAGASHFGGVWESLIRVVRRTLDVILGVQSVNDDALRTLLCEAEAIINSRPLSVVSSDANDALPLTPNRLLNMGESPVAFSDGDCNSYVKKRWKQVQIMADHFWNRWKREYMQNLQVRQKWFKPEKNLKIGDIVLVTNENLPRCHWPLARVTAVKYSKDGLVRSATVKKGDRELERPINKLIMILEADL